LGCLIQKLLLSPKPSFLLAGALLIDKKFRQRATQAVFRTLQGAPKPSSKHKSLVPAFFGDRLAGKEAGLRTYKPSSVELWEYKDVSIKQLRTLDLN
jgi:hypothetical protein